MERDYSRIIDLTPVEFEKWCMEFLKGYAEENDLQDLVIKHNEIIKASDGKYQIDIYAEFTVLNVRFKVLCECKKYKNRVTREKVAVLHRKLESIGAQKGIMISTSDYQKGAIEYAMQHGIALIKAEDYHFEFLSHSSGQTVIDIDDPFLYVERNMPPYMALDYTSKEENPRKVYPTKASITALLNEADKRIRAYMGMDS